MKILSVLCMSIGIAFTRIAIADTSPDDAIKYRKT